MPSATDFFPAYITEFMNLVMMMFPNFGSGSTSRFSAEWRRDICLSFLVMAGLVPPIHDLIPCSGPRVSLRSPGDDLRYAPVTYFGRLAPYFERRCLRFLTP